MLYDVRQEQKDKKLIIAMLNVRACEAVKVFVNTLQSCNAVNTFCLLIRVAELRHTVPSLSW